MDYNLYKLFNKFIKFGFKVRSLKLNGLEEWRNKSKNLSEDNIVGNWKTSRVTANNEIIYGLDNIYDYVYNTLNMKGEDEDTFNPHREEHHFLLQLVRLPKKNTCNKKKIAQIGYNIGQFMACVGSGNYSSDAIKFFHDNKLTRLNSFIDII